MPAKNEKISTDRKYAAIMKFPQEEED